MKVGDVVKVFQKPLTREDFEGKAKVLRITSRRREGNGLLFRAIVNFPEDGPYQAVERWIAEGDVLPGGAA